MFNVQEILNRIAEIGPVLPGKLEMHYNVCGKAGCRCKNPQNPRKHGPYYRLSYSLNGKNSSIFIKKENAIAVEKMTENYKQLRTLTMELALANIDVLKRTGPESISSEKGITPGKTDPVNIKLLQKKTRMLQAAQVKINDLTKSRNSWKRKYNELKEKQLELQMRSADTSVKIIEKEEKKN